MALCLAREQKHETEARECADGGGGSRGRQRAQPGQEQESSGERSGDRTERVRCVEAPNLASGASPAVDVKVQQEREDKASRS